MISRLVRLNLLLCAAISLAGCARSPNVKVYAFDGRRVAYIGRGEGSPVVVLESGYGVLLSTWEPIFDSLSKVTSVYAYDRPGYGRSTQEQPPTTAREVAEQLHQNLVSTGYAPPYVLVGHSVGGLYVNVFARIYPAEVAGVVLIDPSHSLQFEHLREEQQGQYSEFLTTTANGERAYEGSILRNIHAEFASIEPFPDVPLVVLTAETTEHVEYHEDLAGMSAQASHRVVAGSGHFIHQDQPQIVIEEIKSLLNTVQEAE